MEFTKEQLTDWAKCREANAEHYPHFTVKDLALVEIALAVLSAPRLPQSVLESVANAFIAAIEKEQVRLHGEDYLMDSRDCIDVIREELQQLKACRAAMLPDVQGDNHATD
ncbi:MAG: hypothetical protein E6X49_22545 [Leclercia adecarboxylata]|uniref:hypothetical protein n=1 Tax=Leclercia adecarboxylata TaxID=83655 RepID=UPI002913161E|nr:hypothetical protein [Leclercia adecarboxylata]